MNRQQHHYGVVALIMIFWFVISFITNIIGPLIPDIIDNFRLAHLALAGSSPPPSSWPMPSCRFRRAC